MSTNPDLHIWQDVQTTPMGLSVTTYSQAYGAVNPIKEGETYWTWAELDAVKDDADGSVGELPSAELYDYHPPEAHRDAKATMTQATEHYGRDAQVDQCVEENAELIKALATGDRTDVIDELADVRLMTMQLSLVYGRAAVDERIERKLARLRYRLRADGARGTEHDDERLFPWESADGDSDGDSDA